MFCGLGGREGVGVCLGERVRDGRVGLTNGFATEDEVILEGTLCWNDTCSLHLPSGALPSMRRSGELRCCFVFHIRNGKIASLHHYYDMMTLLEQLGLVPVPEQATKEPLKSASLAQYGTPWG